MDRSNADRVRVVAGMALLWLALLPMPAAAVICKIVNANGEVTYTDVPVAECPERVELPEFSRYAPRPIGQAAVGQTAAPAMPGADGSEPFTRYASLKIVQPEPEQVVRTQTGRVTVQLQLEPALQEGHRLRAYLDGLAIPGIFSGTSIVLTGVERGTHSVRARVIDASGIALIESPAVRFTLASSGAFNTGDIRVTVDNITSDDAITQEEVDAGGSVTVSGRIDGAFSGGSTVSFTVNEKDYDTVVNSDGSWAVPVSVADLAAQASFSVTAKGSNFTVSTLSTHTIGPPPEPDEDAATDSPLYAPPPPADYTPSGGGISTTPGRTNPAFAPSYN